MTTLLCKPLGFLLFDFGLWAPGGGSRVRLKYAQLIFI